MIELRDQVDASLVAERLIASQPPSDSSRWCWRPSGLYGVVAYGTMHRTGEIGIRMALGAYRRDVRSLVLRDTLILVVIGVVSGIPVALAGARLLATQLYEVGPNDPLAVSLASGRFHSRRCSPGMCRRAGPCGSIRSSPYGASKEFGGSAVLDSCES